MHNELISYLRPLGRRLRLRNGHKLMIHSLWLPFLVAALVLSLSRLTPLSHYKTLAWTPLALWAVSVTGYSLLHPLPPARVAHATDTELRLRDRLATAIELTDIEAERFDAILVTHQREDALRVARSLDPTQAFPLHWERRPLLIAAFCSVIAVTLVLRPNPMDVRLAERAAVAETAEEQAKTLEELVQDLGDEDLLDPETREELLRQLREAAEALRKNPGDVEEALADLARLEENLRHQLDPQAAARSTSLEHLAENLRDLAGQPQSSEASDLAHMDELLQQLAAQAGELSPDARAQLAQALRDAAARDAALASALNQLGQEIENGNISAETLAEASDALNKAASDAALQEAISQMLSQAQNASSALAQAGQNIQKGNPSQANAGQNSGQQGTSGQSNSASQGQGQNPNESNNPGNGGQGQSQGQGTQGGGGGTTSRTGDPSTRSGQADDPHKPNQGYDVSNFETIFAPWQQGQPGDTDFVPGRQNDTGEETVRENKNPQPGAAGAALTPYRDVYASYATVAAETMERAYIPVGLKDYVRDYFTQLEP